ncbi:SDR family NAD(P)-dependent oxidoreductase [Alcaligenes faecalis]|uniref:type I polyketide synthase n=1 Tax=Alcaligenes faecalis TaxID=511 RepID=UPI00293215CF|nr:SDR family NAD(P)-dependent oxidoreductase [Alcaligenes faecalis]MDV2116214.1 SDR family NAD(P)-dependent oxidoreductase [Alcaligenes faecalis]
MSSEDSMTGLEIAVVGMSGRFPGAPDVQTLWDRLCQGQESVVQYSEEQLRQMGVPDALLRDPDYVPAGIELDAVDQFDAALFAYTPRDAQLLDPQHRVFLECAWHALEHAGYNGAASSGQSVGVYAACGASVYLIRHLLSQNPLNERTSVADVLSLLGGNGSDSLATRVAYKLNLQGPAMAVQTACSSSLTAVHMACQSLLNHECDMALAGGVSLNLLQKGGYLYRNGAIFSRDGHCRAFDAKASGTVLGSGAGVVVLKRLEEACEDGDTIHAVIKGSAVNNDGAEKVGFTAPSIRGQAQVIQAALAVADVPANSISYVETHGTGTVLGDPIEVAALTQAWGNHAEPAQCALGSIKTNIGHLDMAAGVAGLIKASMALRHQVLPASLNFTEPNPQIDFAHSPFYVNTQTRAWPAESTPRRAGVSAFGIGGTNVHVVLQEPPLWKDQAVRAGDDEVYALPLSGHTCWSLTANVGNLAHYLQEHATVPLQDVSSTLIVGRHHLSQRCVALASTTEQAAQVLTQQSGPNFFRGAVLADTPAVAFMFPGQGAQHAGMGRSLYEQYEVYRATVDECCQLLGQDLGLDLRPWMCGDADQTEQADELLAQTQFTQPALFVMEYALARLLMSWGIVPQALIGHSIGEYAAACLAGVFSLPDALHIVALRGRLLQRLPSGAMLAVGLSEAALLKEMPAACDIAAINSHDLCVLSGPVEAIDAANEQLQARSVVTRRLHVSHAFHSAMVEPMLDDFAQALAGITLSRPSIPFISNLSGTWIRPDEAQDPAYWLRHVRATVRFQDGMATLLEQAGRVLLEVGPGQTLSALVRHHPMRATTPVLAVQSHPRQRQDNAQQLLRCLAQLWITGVDIGTSPLFKRERVRRIPLPLYAFDRQSYWVPVHQGPASFAQSDSSETSASQYPSRTYCYIPVWKRRATPLVGGSERQSVLLLASDQPLVRALQQRLLALGHEVVLALTGPSYQHRDADEVQLRPEQLEDITRLQQEMLAQGRVITHICPAWALDAVSDVEAQRMACSLWVSGLLNLAKVFGEQRNRPVRFTLLTTQLEDVIGTERLCAAKALLHGPCKVLVQEYEHIQCQIVDIAEASDSEPALGQIVAELLGKDTEPVVALRGRHRWVKSYEPHELHKSEQPGGLRQGGTYLITGGLGGIAWQLAEHLAQRWQAKLVLIGRYLDTERQARLASLRARGVQVQAYAVDLSRSSELLAALQQARETLGPIHGVFHAAGVPQSRVIHLLGQEDIEPAFAAKVVGTQNLLQAFKGESLDFILFFSSLASVLGGLGKSLYASANAYLDSVAHAEIDTVGDTRLISVNWDGWREVGMAADSQWPAYVGIYPAQGIALLERLLSAPHQTQVLVSTRNLQECSSLDAQALLASEPDSSEVMAVRYPRPALSIDYVEPEGELEESLAALWSSLLGMDGLGSEDSLFELGGDSLLAIQLLARVKARYGVDIPPALFFQDPTIAALAEQVEAELIDQIEQDSLAQ